ncbi:MULTISPECIES: GtrA family protein [Sphingobacterium]|uniref:Polysaccharide biosynthesis protein GtrA n=1 Tax=Sphingobacterium cellulitidis TaxID=1768011 RepID=A0A8H9KV22_9SPHI|nr:MULTISPECIES: GtrA family protein [Sphingobacterium]MBA8988552.1 putative flippase GtrA [Sphingobacterium soli]OYD41204.1 polysaccharide biosynthesis protein GtrA [Sphingobacterium cellulitidis]WFB62759.1 GtrA family protein [Sphingobacterium sp. WM]GGE33713.1 polysaccharide biosynthesis protein GtrA [Sphingobacterium soli]
MSERLKVFLKAQLSAFIGGLSDFGIYTFCYTVLKFTAPFSNVISGSLGAIVNFTINRYWSFDNTETSLGSQLWKFILVVIGSITLKSLGIHLLVDIWHVHFLISKAIVEIIVSLGFNYTLQRFWVFRK